MLIALRPVHGKAYSDLFLLSPATIERYREHMQPKTVYIPHPEPTIENSLEHARGRPHETINLMLPKTTRDSLRAHGYKAALLGPDADHPATHRLILSNKDLAITIEYQHRLQYGGTSMSIVALVMISGPLAESAGEMDGHPRSVSWRDLVDLSLSHPTQVVDVIHVPKRFTVKLGLDYVGLSHYIIRAEIVTETLIASAASGEPMLGKEGRMEGVDGDAGT